DGAAELDASGRLVLPGAIDPHVQFYDPVERYGDHETAFAVQGGVTTVCKMHRSLEDYAPGLTSYSETWSTVAHCDFQLNVAIMTEEHVQQIPAYAAAGIRTFKVFTAYKDQWGERINVKGLTDDQLLRAFRAVAEVDGARVMIHAEGQELLDGTFAR